MPEDVSLLDGLALVLVLAYAVGGLVKGAIRFIIGLATVVAGIILAGTFGESLGAQHWPGVSGLDQQDRIGVLLGCAIIFAGTLLVGAIVARLLRRAAEESDLGGVDRTLGFVFGALRGLLYAELAVAVVMFTLVLFPEMKGLRAQVDGSYALRVTQATARICSPWFPQPMDDWLTETLELPPAAAGSARDGDDDPRYGHRR